jgi:hypothetical protein
MMQKAKRILDLVRNMGPRYVAFRAKHEVMRRSGLLKRSFPKAPPFQQFITLDQWKNKKTKFFFNSRDDIKLKKAPSEELSKRLADLLAGRMLMFSSFVSEPNSNPDWVTNPDSGYKYDARKHWTEIPDYSAQAGDIKYVWERSRFSWIYDVVRYDHHFGDDHGKYVFSEIGSWIDSNPINCGPNYRCSQEISIRLLNWLFALHFYSNSPALSEGVFNKMQHFIYWHLHHIYHNINFSRIAVRNNHAITETLMLYLGGLFFPTMPGAGNWKQKGKEWFEQEIAYQVYEDGTFLQYSMNYHRIVVQLLTWAITLSENNGERFNETVYDRARKSLTFLGTCTNDTNGWLPNYGANDGALFFPLSSTHYRDYRPQLNALAASLGISAFDNPTNEDASWYNINKDIKHSWAPANGTHSFTLGGYYIIREPETLTFIKCGGYKDRPSQADALHLDIWYRGENVIPDAGSYKYNTDAETIRYFSGTRSHNTVMLGDNDQMLKGGRFIWYHWIKQANAELIETADTYEFTGTIQAFGHVAPGIIHTRKIVKQKDRALWSVIDTIKNPPAGIPIIQLWHIAPGQAGKVQLTATDVTKTTLTPSSTTGYISSLYGQKDESTELSFLTNDATVNTVISIE